MLAPLTSSVNAPPLPLSEHLLLELRETGHHCQHQTACWSRRVDPEIQETQMYPAFPQIVSQQQHLGSRSAEAADLGDGYGILTVE